MGFFSCKNKKLLPTNVSNVVRKNLSLNLKDNGEKINLKIHY